MQYLLMIYAEEAATQALDEDARARMLAAYGAYTDTLKEAGVYVGSNRLRPVSSGKTVRLRGGHRSVIDGPFAETKEQLGGYYLIEAPDDASALAWAARCPGAAHGAVEVRPVWMLE